MIVHVGRGDLFASAAQTLVCPVNTAGMMGAGLAATFRRRLPELHADYRRRSGAGQVRLGEPYVWASLLPPWVVVFPTKGADPWARSRLADIDRGLARLADRLGPWGVTSLAVPALGCGHGGLDWHAVGPLLYRRLHATPVPVELYAPPAAPAAQATAAFLTDPCHARPARPPRAVRGRRSVPGRVAYVGRPGPLGNPYRLTDPRDPLTRRGCLQRYRDYLHERAAHDAGFRAELEAVRGLDLGCWCAPLPCHADVILAWLLHHPAGDRGGDPAAAALAAALAPPIGDPAGGERLAVVGSVGFADPHALAVARLVVLDELLRVRPAVVVSGGAAGVDRLAAEVARQLGYDQADGSLVAHRPVPVRNPPAGTSRFEARGYRARDKRVADDATCLLRVVCHRTRTYGSGWTADEAQRQRKPVRQVAL